MVAEPPTDLEYVLELHSLYQYGLSKDVFYPSALHDNMALLLKQYQPGYESDRPLDRARKTCWGQSIGDSHADTLNLVHHTFSTLGLLIGKAGEQSGHEWEHVHPQSLPLTAANMTERSKMGDKNTGVSMQLNGKQLIDLAKRPIPRCSCRKPIYTATSKKALEYMAQDFPDAQVRKALKGLLSRM